MPRSSKNVIFSNLDFNDQVYKRLRPNETGFPGWFGYPIKQIGYDFRCDKNPIFGIAKTFFQRRRCALLCFNPSLIYFFLFILPLPIQRISLFQWKPIGRLPRAKAFVIWLILRRSHEILVYSHIAARYLQRQFPQKRVYQLGLYTDENFFSPPLLNQIPNSTFILAPGDHKREERLLGEVADKLNVNVVRVTRNAEVRNAVETLAHPRVELRYNISFEELRALYCTCKVVLILSDSSEIPTGITTLSEALSCGSDVVISNGHSNSWPPEISRALPFATVRSGADANEVAEAVVRQGTMQSKCSRRERARQFALSHLSETAVSQDWRKILRGSLRA